jgi:type VI secretion system FHA domain protein
VERRAPSNHSGSAFDWDGFLRAAGVDPARVPPETAAALGNIMRSVVQGLIEVLRARTEIKTEFRMPVTQVKVSENNPLKFAANADDALGNLLGKRNPAYLPPQEAFDDAFNDVRFHQLAMLAGVRAGFDNLLNRFDPAQLQELFERQGKRGGLFGGGKASYWDRYAERYGEMTADRDETFRRLFGEEFARAYEQQLSVLKRSRGENK